MQTHKIKLNEILSSRSGSSNESPEGLVFLNGYYIYIDRIGGGMVNQNNVRVFLNDIRNSDLIQRFVSHLTATTSEERFVEIVGSDDLLARNFNRFHDAVILSGQSTISPITNSDTQNITAQTISGQFIYNEWNNGFEDITMIGSQPSHINPSLIYQSFSAITFNSIADNYYIPVFINQSFQSINEDRYRLCNESYPLLIQQIEQSEIGRTAFIERSIRYDNVLQCFVGNNFETNHNYPYQRYIIPDVGFSNNLFSVVEGNSISIQISLSTTSQGGLEECEISVENIDTENNDFLSSMFPLIVRWNIGESDKEIQLQSISDQLVESFELLKLKITRATNCNIVQETSEAFITIEDNTEIRTLSIIGFDSIPENESLRGSLSPYSISLVEGESYEIQLSLDAPSTFGTERIKMGVFSSSGQEVDGIQLDSGNIISWQIGEQNKSITINAIIDSFIENEQEYIIRFYDPEFINIPFLNEIRLIVNESEADVRYFAIDLFNIYRQRGELENQSASELVLGCIQNGSTTNSDTFNCLISLGSTYYDNTITSLHEQSNYIDYPIYSFGMMESGRKPSLLVKNVGTHPVSFQGLVYNVGDNIELQIDESSTEFVFPTNSGILAFGQTPQGETSPLTADTLTTGTYEFYIKMPEGFLVDSNDGTLKDTHLFSLKGSNLNNNSRFIGNFTFYGKPTEDGALNEKMYLYSKYRNFRTQMIAGSCLDSFMGIAKVKNVRIRGIVLLSQNSMNTNYIQHSFSSYGDFNPVCGFGQGSYNGQQLSGIPFEIY